MSFVICLAAVSYDNSRLLERRLAVQDWSESTRCVSTPMVHSGWKKINVLWRYFGIWEFFSYFEKSRSSCDLTFVRVNLYTFWITCMTWSFSTKNSIMNKTRMNKWCRWAITLQRHYVYIMQPITCSVLYLNN